MRYNGVNDETPLTTSCHVIEASQWEQSRNTIIRTEKITEKKSLGQLKQDLVSHWLVGCLVSIDSIEETCARMVVLSDDWFSFIQLRL